MRHKLFSLFLALVVNVGTMFAWDYERVQIGDLYYNLDAENQTAEVTESDGDKYSGDIIIPQSVNYSAEPYSVTSIGGGAFYGCSSLTSIEIPNSVTSIGEYAFDYCIGLISVTIPNSVTSIGGHAFSRCTGLTSIIVESRNSTYDSRDNCNAIIETATNTLISGCKNTIIPNGVKSIGSYAFYNCTGLTSIEIPNSITSIGSSAFQYCSGLTSISIPNSVTSIGSSAFYGCTGLPIENNLRYADTYLVEVVDKTASSYTIKEGTRWIGDNAFSNCTSLTSIKIPNSVISIENGAFNSCYNLTSVTIGNSVTSIGGSNVLGSGAFSYCTSLTSIEIPNSVTNIGHDTFRDCTGLTSISIPNSVTSIGYRAFYNCKSLTSVTIPNSVTSIGYDAFDGCTGITSLIYNAHVFAFMPSSYTGAYTIPNGIESIAGGAFNNCPGLTSVTIPNSVTRIDGSAFYSCPNLMSIEVAKNNPNYCSIDGVLYNKDITSLFKYPAAKAASYYSIPNSVTYIGYGAFLEAGNLVSVDIPNNVTRIEDYAFRGCTSLTSIDIPNSVTYIGWYAFYGCTGLTSATIGNGVTIIEINTFYDCTSLASIEIPNGVLGIEDRAFYNCKSLTSIEIPNSVTGIGNSAFYNCTSLTSIEIPNSIKYIGNSAFYNCTSLTTVTIGTGGEWFSIDYSAFYRCSGLTSVTCYASTPPVGSSIWYKVDVSKIPLYVPAESVEAYKAADQWKDFGSILPITAEEKETEDIQTTPTNNSVDIVWPAVAGAASYELVIKDAEGNKICTLVFNANGQLVSLVFHAPARNNAPQHQQAAGFVFTVTGLDPGKEYTYTFTATNNTGDVLRTESGTFRTNGTQDIDAIQAEKSQSTKITQDGKILILRGDHTYTLTGQEVK